MMFFRKEKKELFEKMQDCLNGIQENNVSLAKTIDGIVENQELIKDELNNIQSFHSAYIDRMKNSSENDYTISDHLEGIQTNNIALIKSLDKTNEMGDKVVSELLDSKQFFAGIINNSQNSHKTLIETLDKTNDVNNKVVMDLVKTKDHMSSFIDNVQSNNTLLTETLHILTESLNESKNKSRTVYTEEDKWKVAYALNLCTVSVSQIIEYNDLRFMDQEYENILNNLNLEMMPKDETLLDILKQILDIITYFRIQSKEKELLDKKYQQKIKDAIWNAAPNPTVIMSGGSGGWVGLAVSAAISLGTGYMNYRKEKAKINLEREEDEWKLERSLMEQLHGLRRQLFETAWRLSDEYEFTDELRLTEKQIKHFNAILQDDNALRQYGRFECVHLQYKAYPPFWYYYGAAALKVAYEYKDDGDICSYYLNKANDFFDYYFEKCAYDKKLLREDPIVAQSCFEYIAMLNMKEEKNLLNIGKDEKNSLIFEKLGVAVKSSGNSLDVLQLCAIQYLAIEQYEDAMSILKVLVNEYYNVSSNAQLLSMLYAKAVLLGRDEYRADYKLLKQTCPYSDIEFYRMPFGSEDERVLDSDFCNRQKIYLAKKYVVALEKYLKVMEERFNNIWSGNFDVSEDLVRFFEDISTAMSLLRPEVGSSVLKQGISDAVEKIRKEYPGVDIFSDMTLRQYKGFSDFVEAAILKIVDDIMNQLKSAITYSDLSALESKLFEFCNKYSLIDNVNNEINLDSNCNPSIESILTGKSVSLLKVEKQQFEEMFAEITKSKLKENIINFDSKKDAEVLCYYSGSRLYEDYFNKHRSIIEKLEGKVLAVIEDRRGLSKTDLIFTTKRLCVLVKHFMGDERIEYKVFYSEARISNKKTSIENLLGEKIYDQAPKEIDYTALGELFNKLQRVADKYGVHDSKFSSWNEKLEPLSNGFIRLCDKTVQEPPVSYTIAKEYRRYSSPKDVRSVAKVTSVVNVEKGISVFVTVKEGSFSLNDRVKILNQGDITCKVGIIVNIYTNGTFLGKASKGVSSIFTFDNLKKEDVEVGAEIVLDD